MIPVPTWLTRTVLYVIGGVVAVLALWWLIATLTGGKRATVEAKLNSNISGAALASGKDAVDTVGDEQASESAADAMTIQNAVVIHSAVGADAPVAPEVRNAGLLAICHRAAARSDPKCAKH